MQNVIAADGDAGTIKVASRPHLASRQDAGRAIRRPGLARLLAAIVLVQILYATGAIDVGFANWRPVLYAYLLWAVALGVGQVLIRGERGQRALFLLPAVLFTVAMVIFPTLFGLYIAFTDWNLSSLRRAAASTASTISRPCSTTILLLERARQHGLLRAGGARSNTRSPSAWRCCSTPRSARASSSASSSCCPSC